MKKILALSAGALALLTFIVFVAWGLGGWVLMLLVGAIHHSIWAAVPALSYWQSVLVYAILSLIGGLVGGTR